MIEIALPLKLISATVALQKPGPFKLGEFGFDIVTLLDPDIYTALHEAYVAGERVRIDGLPFVLTVVGALKKEPIETCISGRYVAETGVDHMVKCTAWGQALLKRADIKLVFQS